MNKKGTLILFVLLGIAVLALFFAIANYCFGITCKLKSIGEDKYCHSYETSGCNSTSCLTYTVFEVRSHEQDEINRIERERKAEERRLKEEARQECYNAGEYYNITLDIQENYGYNCRKLAYINDHFVDKTRKVDGGYIEGSSSGFVFGYAFGFSSGYTKGQFYEYVTEGVSATGQLIENTQFHLDCNGIKSGEKIDYYTESEFVMYYVDNCII